MLTVGLKIVGDYSSPEVGCAASIRTKSARGRVVQSHMGLPVFLLRILKVVADLRIELSTLASSGQRSTVELVSRNGVPRRSRAFLSASVALRVHSHSL